MAINTQKLLPSAKKSSKSAIVKADKFIVPVKKIETKKISAKQLSGGDDISSENNVKLLTDIDKLLKNILASQNKNLERKRKDDENKDFEERESKLEEEKQLKKSGLPTNLIPKTGFLDRLKNFLLFTFLGWLFTNTYKYLPKLQFLGNIIGGVIDFTSKFLVNLTTSLINFIDGSYKIYDEIKKKTKEIGGENAEKIFDETSKNLNLVLNAAIITSLAAVRVGFLSGAAGGAGASAAARGFRGVTTSGGRILGRPDLRNPLRQRPTVTRGGGGGLRFPGTGPRVTQGAGGKLAQRAALRTLKPLTGRIPIIGGLIEFGLSWALGDPIGKAAFRGIGSVLLGAVGAAVGGPVGAFVGAWAGGEGGAALYDVIFGGKKPIKPAEVQKKQRGGPVSTSSGRPGVRRGIRTISIKRPPKAQPQKTQPGKDAAGKNKIAAFYSKPGSATSKYERPPEGWLSGLGRMIFGGGGGTTTTSGSRDFGPYNALTKISETLKQIPFIGNLMGASVDIALGQKPDKKVYKSLGEGLGYLIRSIANQQTSLSLSNLTSSIMGMADGGTVPNRGINAGQNNNPGDMVSKVLSTLIEQRVNEALKQLNKETEKTKSGEGVAPQGLDTSPGNIRVTSDSPDFWLLVTAALFENGAPEDGYQGAADVAQAIYNRVALPGWPKSIRGVILQPGQFSPVNGYGGVNEWSKINSKESAVAFARKYKGYTGNIVERIAATLLDRTKQEKARTFVGPRDNFRTYGSEAKNNHLDDSTEVRRYNHVFGFEPGGANIGRFRKGQIMPAEINKQIVTGNVEQIPEFGSGQGRNQPNVRGKSGYVGSTNVVDTGYKDAQGRPIKLNPGAAQAFKDMIAAGMPFRSSDVANVYRDEKEYLRLINAGYSPAANSTHNYGEGADIHGAMNTWIKRNGTQYGWYYTPYSGTHGGHFEWKGRSSRLSSQTSTRPTPTQQPRQGSGGRPSTAEQLRQRGIPVQGRLQGGGLIGPSKSNQPIPNSFASYENYGQGRMMAIQPMIVEKQVPVPMKNSNPTIMFGSAALNSNSNQMLKIG